MKRWHETPTIWTWADMWPRLMWHHKWPKNCCQHLRLLGHHTKGICQWQKLRLVATYILSGSCMRKVLVLQLELSFHSQGITHRVYNHQMGQSASIIYIPPTLMTRKVNTVAVVCRWGVRLNAAQIFNKNNKKLAVNYLPVSLATKDWKTHILNRTYKHILSHLDLHKIMTTLYLGFHYTFSCKLQTTIIILDFSRSFDTVPHYNLLYKL